MRLIEILVRDLPKFGGWPDGVKEVEQECGGELIEMGNYSDYYSDFRLELGDDWEREVVTHDEYEAALAASKEMLVNKPVAWDGQGLPPVGCTCEYSLNNGRTWHECKLDYLVGSQGAVLSCDVFEGVQYVHFCNYDGEIFRPIRTETERKRKEAIDAIAELCRSSASNGHSAELIYAAIEAGSIPGVKLEAPDA